MIKLNGNFIPDPVWHRNISFAKSFIRIAAGSALLLAGGDVWVWAAGALLIGAEILGIVEEIV